MGVAEREAGRVLPGASKAAKATAVPARTGAAAWIHIQTSNGKHFEIHPEDLGEAQRRDPGLKVLDSLNQ